MEPGPIHLLFNWMSRCSHGDRSLIGSLTPVFFPPYPPEDEAARSLRCFVRTSRRGGRLLEVLIKNS